MKPESSVKGALKHFDRVGPKWMKRAMQHPEYHTKDNESILTKSGSWMNKEILFPTVRMRGPGLEKLGVLPAFKESIKRKDYIEFEGKDLNEAIVRSNRFAGELSDELGRRGDKARLRKKVKGLIVRTPWKRGDK